MTEGPKLYDRETERSLVGAAFLDPALFGNTVHDPDDFYLEDMRLIWYAGRDLYQAGTIPDITTLANELDRRGAGIEYSFLLELMQSCVSVAYAETYAATVHEYAERRRLHERLIAALTGMQNGSDIDAVTTDLVADLNRMGETRKAERSPVKSSWTIDELLDADFPEPQWAVPGIIPVGLTFLAGRPKVGKSWLALQVAIAVAAGGMVLNQHVGPGKVLYLAYEDNGRRLKDRVTKQGAKRGTPLRLATSWRRLTEGGLQDLETAIEQEGYTLVTIDTLSRALGRADQMDATEMTLLVGRLQEIALAHNVAILVIDHHRKPAGFEGDPVDDIVGSTAKSAVADAALGLFKEQGKKGATLKVTGRDLEWQELVLSWDATTCCWHLEGTAEEVALQGRRKQLLELLRNAPDTLTLTELAEMSGIAKGNALPILNDLVTEGLVERLSKRGKEVPYRIIAK